MSINNPPLKWQERKGWNALGGEERERSGLLFSPSRISLLSHLNSRFCAFILQNSALIVPRAASYGKEG